MSIKIKKIQILLFAGIILFGYALIIQRIPNQKYGKVYYRWALECEGDCPVSKKLKLLKKAAFHDPLNSDVYYQIGLVNESQGGSSRDSVRNFYQAVMLNREHFPAHLKVGEHYLKEDHPSFAIHFIRQGLQSSDFSVKERSHILIGGYYQKLKNWDAAVSHYKSAISFNSESTQAIYQLGLLYLERGLLDLVEKQIANLYALNSEILAQSLTKFLQNR